MFALKVAKPQTKAAANPTSKFSHQPSALAARRQFRGGAVEQAQQVLMLQRSVGNQATLRLLPRLRQQLQQAAEHGSRIDPRLRAPLEAALRTDLSGVSLTRIHTPTR